MKESIGGTQLFIIVVALVLLFSGIMALTINRSNAFAVKDQIVTLIEKHGKFDMNTQYNGDESSLLGEILENLKHNSYRQTGKCPTPGDGQYNMQVTAYNRDGSIATSNNRASFCIVRIDGNSPEGTVPVVYYEVVVFYNLDLPVIKSLFNFKLKGQTKALYA